MNSIDRVNISNPSLDPSFAIKDKDQVRTGQPGQTSSAKDDSVTLSPSAIEIDRIVGLVSKSREERIEQVRQMIEAGEYSVSSSDIARKLIESNWR